MAEDNKKVEVVPSLERFEKEVAFVRDNATISDKGVEVSAKESSRYLEEQCGVPKDAQVAYRKGKADLTQGALVVAQKDVHLKKMKAAKEAGDDMSAVRTTVKVVTGTTAKDDSRSTVVGTLYGSSTTRNPGTGETKETACSMRLNEKVATGIRRGLTEEFNADGMSIIEGDV